MDLSKVKTNKEIVERKPEYIESAKSYEQLDEIKKKDDKLQSKIERAVQKKELKKQRIIQNRLKSVEKQEVLDRKLSLAKKKAELAQYKATQRQYGVGSRLSNIARGLSRRTTPSGEIQRQKRLATDSDTRRQVALQRGALAYEREQTSKYGFKGEGEGELPYYEKEYQKPLPKKDIAVKSDVYAPSTTITNGHRISKKKNLREELF